MSIKYFKVKRTYPSEPDLNYTTFEGYVRPSTGPHSPVTPYGEVGLRPGFEVPNFNGERLSGEPLNYGSERSEDQLFTHIPPKIDNAFVDHRIRAAVAPTILGMAYNEARKTGIPTYSSSLSKYSAPLVRHALEKGLVQPNENNMSAGVTNSVGRDEPVVVESHYKYQDRMKEAAKGGATFSIGFGDLRETSEVPEQDVAAAKQTVRNVVRPPKPAPAPHVNPQQFEQLKLEL